MHVTDEIQTHNRCNINTIDRLNINTHNRYIINTCDRCTWELLNAGY